jgi:pantoate--beta-alanine ligase
MGSLHKGHLSLIEKSIQENEITIVTIFVNPKQFGPNEDFDKYPRNLDEDLGKISTIALLITAKKEIVVFAPQSIEDIYPIGFTTTISVGSMTQKLEGKIRPTHFDGVTTVVYRLFSITKADTAYFGQKDIQQCLIVKKMIRDLDIQIKIHIMPIVRNSEGLALSSRNQFLSENEKTKALTLPNTLLSLEKLIQKKEDYMPFMVKAKSLDPNWDYLEVLDSSNLELPNKSTNEFVIIGAYKAGTTRLLDNILITINSGK